MAVTCTGLPVRAAFRRIRLFGGAPDGRCTAQEYARRQTCSARLSADATPKANRSGVRLDVTMTPLEGNPVRVVEWAAAEPF